MFGLNTWIARMLSLIETLTSVAARNVVVEAGGWFAANLAGFGRIVGSF